MRLADAIRSGGILVLQAELIDPSTTPATRTIPAVVYHPRSTDEAS